MSQTNRIALSTSRGTFITHHVIRCSCHRYRTYRYYQYRSTGNEHQPSGHPCICMQRAKGARGGSAGWRDDGEACAVGWLRWSRGCAGVAPGHHPRGTNPFGVARRPIKCARGTSPSTRLWWWCCCWSAQCTRSVHRRVAIPLPDNWQGLLRAISTGAHRHHR